jgi:hypothetical protein
MAGAVARGKPLWTFVHKRRSVCAMSTRRELWGYAVWGAMGVVIAVPELWAAIGGKTVEWPTISGTVGYLEYWHVWVSIIVVGVLVWAAFNAVQYEASKRVAAPDQAYRTPGGRVSRREPNDQPVNAIIYFAGAIVIIVGLSLWAYLDRPDDKYRLGEVMYGLIALFWMVIPASYAYFGGKDVPFPTLFATIQALEQRARVVAIVFAAGIAVLLIHLALYPWPAVIPDLQDLHASNAPHHHAVKKLSEPQPGAP